MKKLLLLAVALAFLPGAAVAATSDCSKTTVAADQAVTLIPAGSAINGFVLQNIDTNDALWFSWKTTAKANNPGSFVLPPAQAKAFAASSLFIFGLNGVTTIASALTAVAANAGHPISCAYW